MPVVGYCIVQDVVRQERLLGSNVDSDGTDHVHSTEPVAISARTANDRCKVAYPKASEAGMPKTGRVTSDRSV